MLGVSLGSIILKETLGVARLRFYVANNVTAECSTGHSSGHVKENDQLDDDDTDRACKRRTDKPFGEAYLVFVALLLINDDHLRFSSIFLFLEIPSNHRNLNDVHVGHRDRFSSRLIPEHFAEHFHPIIPDLKFKLL